MYKPDFLIIRQSVRGNGPGRPKSDGSNQSFVYWPDFEYMQSRDLMVQGKAFYAIWDEENGIWSRNLNRAVEIVDKAVDDRVSELYPEGPYPKIDHLREDSTGRMTKFLEYMKHMPDNFTDLDMTVTFINETRSRDEFVSKTLPYSLEAGEPESYIRMMTTLYSPTELQKLEWAVGSILAGDSSRIQKFIVLYGDSGTGKSTFLRVLAALFDGYRTTFTAADMSTKRDAFAMEMFQGNPLVAIDDDGDLSKIEDNSLLNRVVSHEEVPVNAKFKSKFNMRPAAMLFVGTNRKVKITERKSGLLRRLIDVEPTGDLVSRSDYNALMHKMLNFELGRIANRCLGVYNSLGPNAYDGYKAITMISGTNRIFNFVVDYRDKFTSEPFLTREQMWAWYKQWCTESGEFPIKRIEFGEEMMSYFTTYQARVHKDDSFLRNVYIGFKTDLVPLDWTEGSGRFDLAEPVKERKLELSETKSPFDGWYADAPAQYWMDGDRPFEKAWDYVTTKLRDLDTSKTHGVRLEPNHIVLDFDAKGPDGSKNLDRNLVAASHFPDTYAEVSQSGGGVHLHYFYDGDVEKLADSYSQDIEIKKFAGKRSCRRKVTRCNSLPMATLSEGTLPKKGEKRKMVDLDGFKNEKVLRSQIIKCLRKEVHPNTRPNVDFIAKLLDEAQASGEFYDVEDLHSDVISFAQQSTNQSAYCMRQVAKMKFSSKGDAVPEDSYPPVDKNKDGRTIIPNEELTFFDIEIFPNVFIVCYKHYGESAVQKMVNPTPEEVRKLYELNLVGFNNRSYDNHIIWAAGMLNYTPYQLYTISQKIIGGDETFKKFPQAYGLSYTDVWDFASNKQGLKKWEIELGIDHVENSYDWDKPLDERHWFEVVDYCANDVKATETVFDHCHDDYTARCILATLAGSVPNQSTRNLVKKVIFGDLKDIRSELVYTDLSETFPGYKYENGVSTYKGFEVGEGGLVFAKPGIYSNVKTFDVASMHPASLIALSYFGKYTQKYAEMREARIAIKHKDYGKAKKLLDGKLAPFLDDPDIDPKALANALKLVLNSTYGYTKMTTVLDFVHPKNKDNIIAKRGALFMINLLTEVQARGAEAIHVKTDSIKIVDPSPELEEFIISYGKEYGYDFEVESEYDRIALVNDAVYIAHSDKGWEPTGKQFAEPYVYKTLFSGEDIEFDDLCQTKSVSKAKMYIDLSKDGKPSYKFVGAVGRFCPMNPRVIGAGPLVVYRNDKYSAVTGTKGYSWMESEMVRGENENYIDVSYFEELAKKAKDKISEFGDFEKFVKGEL